MFGGDVALFCGQTAGQKRNKRRPIEARQVETLEVQGHGVDEPEAVALAVARSMQPGSEPQDEPDEPVEGEAAESDGSGEEEQGEPARYRGSEF